jgi:hypothetical protein
MATLKFTFEPSEPEDEPGVMYCDESAQVMTPTGLVVASTLEEGDTLRPVPSFPGTAVIQTIQTVEEE